MFTWPPPELMEQRMTAQEADMDTADKAAADKCAESVAKSQSKDESRPSPMDGMPALVPGQVLEELNEVVIQGSKELPQIELDPMVGQGIEKHSQEAPHVIRELVQNGTKIPAHSRPSFQLPSSNVPESDHEHGSTIMGTLDGDETGTLEDIKARTMYRMVEDVGDGRRLLFMTCRQARLLASMDGSTQRLLDAFELPKPKLIINLICSPAGPSFCELLGLPHPWPNGIFDGLDAQERLMRFLHQVLIPLAVETNAIVICMALKGQCMLSEAFGQALALQRSRWTHGPPFSVIGIAGQMGFLHSFTDGSAVWKRIRNKSATWRRRYPLITQVYGETTYNEPYDLDENLYNYIVCDSIMEKTGGTTGHYLEPFSAFTASILRQFTSTLPGLSIKTGSTYSAPENQDGMSALGRMIDVMETGCPLVLLDLRQPSSLPRAPMRREYIEQHKEEYCKLCEELLEAGAEDLLTASAMSRLHDVLFGCLTKRVERPTFVPLHYAIECAAHRDEEDETEELLADSEKGAQGMTASHNAVADLVHWFVSYRNECRQRQVSVKGQGWKPDTAEMSAESVKPDTIIRERSQMTTVLSHQRCHSINIAQLDKAKSSIRELVHLDRLPESEDLEGLLLLRDAWDEHDIKNNLAKYYKTVSKIFYTFVLVVGIAVVFCTAWQSQAEKAQIQRDLCMLRQDACITEYFFEKVDPEILGHVVFGLSIVAAMLVSMLSFANPMQRWRRLRASCSAMQSTIFQYRAHIGDFALSNTELYAHHAAFRNYITNWRKEVIGGTDLAMTLLERQHKANVFWHFQYDGGLLHPSGNDDFHSPLKPTEYIRSRLQSMQAFYQRKLPVYAKYRLNLQFAVVTCSSASALLAYFQRGGIVAIVSSVAAGITSWVEFSQYGKKMERYTSAIQALKNLVTWWNSLSSVEKASMENITKLVLDSEFVIADEFRAWGSSPAHRGHGEGGQAEDNGQGDGVQAQSVGAAAQHQAS